ncbi:hypothetical protein F5Y12DRAFT_432648 [Xylaria sp. FL1777]|nr:hypothetical protein F5Y12DRAFT_432648 [Xylaria sp. FL1777]
MIISSQYIRSTTSEPLIHYICSVQLLLLATIRLWLNYRLYTTRLISYFIYETVVIRRFSEQRRINHQPIEHPPHFRSDFFPYAPPSGTSRIWLNTYVLTSASFTINTAIIVTCSLWSPITTAFSKLRRVEGVRTWRRLDGTVEPRVHMPPPLNRKLLHRGGTLGHAVYVASQAGRESGPQKLARLREHLADCPALHTPPQPLRATEKLSQ